MEEFFKLIEASVEPRAVIHSIVRRRRRTDPPARVSFLFFQRSLKPAFLDATVLLDEIHGFVLLVEAGDVVALLSKNASSPERHLPKHLTRLDFKSVLGISAGDDTAFESIALRTLGARRGTLVRRSYEADDLRAVMPRAGARRSAPTAIKMRQGTETSRLAPGTARVSRQGAKVDLTEFCRFVAVVGNATDKQSPPSFLDVFAQPVRLADLSDDVVPNSVLIHWSDVEDRLLDGDLRRADDEGKVHATTDAEHEATRNLLTRDLVVKKLDEKTYSVSKAKQLVGTLRRTASKFTFQSELLSRLLICHEDEETPLDKLLSNEQLFTVGFNDPSYNYTASAIFRNRAILEEFSSFLSCFVPLCGLKKATSEKGTFTEASTSFSADSVFGVVEAWARSDVKAMVICDDLGIEWADHIVLRDNPSPEIEFVHSKWKLGDSSSASAFHDLVSQAVKNLGNMVVDSDEFDKRCLDKWSGNYISKSCTTEIPRIRSEHDGNECSERYRKLRAAISTRLTMSLAASFLSKSKLEAHARDLTEGASVSGNVMQLVWILASFVDTCRANSVDSRIYCAP